MVISLPRKVPTYTIFAHRHQYPALSSSPATRLLYKDEGNTLVPQEPRQPEIQLQPKNCLTREGGGGAGGDHVYK